MLLGSRFLSTIIVLLHGSALQARLCDRGLNLVGQVVRGGELALARHVNFRRGGLVSARNYLRSIQIRLLACADCWQSSLLIGGRYCN